MSWGICGSCGGDKTDGGAVCCAKCARRKKEKGQKEAVDHPNHYGGKDNPYEAIKVIEAWNLDFYLGNVLKYIRRAGKKDETKEIEDLSKAVWHLQRKIDRLRESEAK